jgi:hypothetical protein
LEDGCLHAYLELARIGEQQELGGSQERTEEAVAVIVDQVWRVKLEFLWGIQRYSKT